MNREIPPLRELILKTIARYPSKCMSEAGVLKLLNALDRFPNEDIVQLLVDSITESGRMTDEAIPVIIYKNRRSIHLANSKITGRYLLAAIAHCATTLQHVNVGGCFQVDDGKLSDLLESCPNLVSINVRNCRKVTDRFLEELVKYPQLPLEQLDIGGDYNITDNGVKKFIESCKALQNLKHFSVSGLPIQDDTVQILVKKLRSISSLGLAYLDISQSTWALVLSELGPQLKTLDISWPSTLPLSRHAQPLAELLVNAIVDCPNLVDIDITGNKSFGFAQVVDLVEKRYSKTQESPTTYKQFQIIRAKFIASPKSTLENQLKVYMDVIKFVL